MLKYCLIMMISISNQPMISVLIIHLLHFLICDFLPLPVLLLSKDLSIKPLLGPPSNNSMKTFHDVKLIKTLAMAKQVVHVVADDHMDKYSLFISLCLPGSDFQRPQVLLARTVC